MQPNGQQIPQPPKKLVDFNKELEELCKKYQYELRPTLVFDPIRGIFPNIQAFDVSPADMGVPLSPTAPVAPAEAAEQNAPVDPAVDKPATN
jgi:hypothetical protein